MNVPETLASILIGFLLTISISPLQNTLVANAASANATSIDSVMVTVFPIFYVAILLCYWGIVIYKVVEEANK